MRRSAARFPRCGFSIRPCAGTFARSTAGLIWLAARFQSNMPAGGTRRILRHGSMAAKMEVRISGVQFFRSRYGKWYAYHRSTRKRIKAPHGTAAFLAELEALDAQAA